MCFDDIIITVFYSWLGVRVSAGAGGRWKISVHAAFTT